MACKGSRFRAIRKRGDFLPPAPGVIFLFFAPEKSVRVLSSLAPPRLCVSVSTTHPVARMQGRMTNNNVQQ